MCIANIANQVEFLNLVSNEDQRDDGPTAEGAAQLDAAFAELGETATDRLMHDVKVDAAKVEHYDAMVAGLQQMEIQDLTAFERLFLKKALRIQRGELP